MVLEGAFDIPPQTVQTWKHRDKLIALAELVVVPAMALTPEIADLLRCRDILWFIDNLATLKSLIKVNSTQENMTELTMVSSVAMVALGTRTYYEWVRSSANVADNPSRGKRIVELPGRTSIQIQLNIDWEAFNDTGERALQLLARLSA